MKDENKKILTVLEAQAKILGRQGEILAAYTKRFDATDKRLEAQAKILGRQGEILAAHTKRFDATDKRLEAQAKTLAEHGKTLVEQAKTLEKHSGILNRIDATMVTRDDLRDFATKADLRKLSTTLEEIAGLARKKDEELMVGGYQIEVLQKRVNALEEDVNKKIKPALSLS